MSEADAQVIWASSVTGTGGHPWEEAIGDSERVVAPYYQGDRRFRASRGLLMIDFYNRAFGVSPQPLVESVLSEPSSCGMAGWESLPSARSVLDTAREVMMPVVYTVSDMNMQGPAGAVTAVQRDESLAPEKDPAWSNQIKSELRPQEGELTVVKSRASAFYGTALDAYLRMKGIDALIICGESTSGCVRATVVDAYSRGFDVVVVEEAVFDRSPLSHRASLFDMNLKYATVVQHDIALEVMKQPCDLVLRVGR